MVMSSRGATLAFVAIITRQVSVGGLCRVAKGEIWAKLKIATKKAWSNSFSIVMAIRG
jgi:hypothetical protein